jgi:hypothetical protein
VDYRIKKGAEAPFFAEWPLSLPTHNLPPPGLVPNQGGHEERVEERHGDQRDISPHGRAELFGQKLIVHHHEMDGRDHEDKAGHVGPDYKERHGSSEVDGNTSPGAENQQGDIIDGP